MARFYGEIKGSRGMASRMGTKNSGFYAHIRGWNIGIRVELSVDKDGNDLISVYKTGGSNYGGGELIGTFSEVEKKFFLETQNYFAGEGLINSPDYKRQF